MRQCVDSAPLSAQLPRRCPDGVYLGPHPLLLGTPRRRNLAGGARRRLGAPRVQEIEILGIARKAQPVERLPRAAQRDFAGFPVPHLLRRRETQPAREHARDDGGLALGDGEWHDMQREAYEGERGPRRVENVLVNVLNARAPWRGGGGVEAAQKGEVVAVASAEDDVVDVLLDATVGEADSAVLDNELRDLGNGLHPRSAVDGR